MSRAELQPDAAVLAVADDLLDRLGGDATTRFRLLGDARFQVVEKDAIELARALGAMAAHEPGEPDPRYVRVAFGLERVPDVGSYLTVNHEGQASVCCVLVVAGHDVEDLDLPGAPLQPGHALLAVWRVEDLEGTA